MTRLLSRRDRAACALGYECLRAGDLTDAMYALDVGGPFTATLVDATNNAEMRGATRPILRARLALALRALLRADAGDMGAWWVHVDTDGEESSEDSDGAPHGRDYCRILAHYFGGDVRLRAPLWSLARKGEG